MMFQQMKSRFKQNPPHFILCILADKKFSDLYGLYTINLDYDNCFFRTRVNWFLPDLLQ